MPSTKKRDADSKRRLADLPEIREGEAVRKRLADKLREYETGLTGNEAETPTQRTIGSLVGALRSWAVGEKSDPEPEPMTTTGTASERVAAAKQALAEHDGAMFRMRNALSRELAEEWSEELRLALAEVAHAVVALKVAAEKEEALAQCAFDACQLTALQSGSRRWVNCSTVPLLRKVLRTMRREGFERDNTDLLHLKA